MQFGRTHSVHVVLKGMWVDLDVKYDPVTLATAGPEEQIRVMEAWFRHRYQDPGHCTPYESAEGGYIWVSGGPYDAGVEIEDQFSGIVPDEVIEQLVHRLRAECPEWAPVPSLDDYDTELYDAVRENDKAAATLHDALHAIESLLALTVAEPAASVHRRLLFANVIAALETFLSDTFINRVLASDVLLQRYLDTEKAFHDRKFPLKDSLRMAREIKELATKELIEMVWHNLGKVKSLYSEVLSVDLGDIGPVATAVQIRHDIVHRNGRNKDGQDRVIGVSHINELIAEVRMLAIRIDCALHPEPALEEATDLPF